MFVSSASVNKIQVLRIKQRILKSILKQKKKEKKITVTNKNPNNLFKMLIII